jgi:hypothetical protein
MSMELPAAKFGHATAVFRSTGYKALPVALLPCTNEQERAMLDALIEDLNTNFMTNLSTEFSTARNSSTASAATGGDIADMRFIIVGASHASRLASALREMGAEVADLAVPGWKITDESVDANIALLKEVLEEEWTGDTIIVYQLFDNSAFFGISADSTASLPVKGTDGKYHVEGALGMIDRDNFKQLFSKSVPLLRAGGQNKKVLISPLGRYALESCCDDASHCSNRGSGLTQVLTEGLANLETWVDDQAYLKRIRNFMTFNPNDFFSPDEDPITKKDARIYKQCWKAGPVHMTQFGYEKLAAALIEALEEGNFSRVGNTSASVTTVAVANPSNRIPRLASRGGQQRFDLSKHRQSWITKSDTVAHRNNDDNNRQHGNNRGGGKWRGRAGPYRGHGGPFRGHGGRGNFWRGRGKSSRPY